MSESMNQADPEKQQPQVVAMDVKDVTTVLEEDEFLPADYGVLSEDEQRLVALGYKQEFKREFNLWTIFCISFSVLGLLPGIAETLFFGMGYAGTAGMVWGWLVAASCIQCLALSMAELASSMPTSGGLYYAACVLAPEGWGPFAAWVTGWSNWLGQVTGAGSIDYGLSAMILAIATVFNPSYVPKSWHTFLLATLLLILHGLLTSVPTRYVARFHNFSTWINISFLLIVVVAIPTATTRTEPKLNTHEFVWKTFTNGTEWPEGIAVLMSFLAVIWTFGGIDVPFHLSEECSNAAVAAPRAIALTTVIGGIFGWLLNLVVAYTVVDIPSVINSEIGQPFIAYLLQCLSERAAVAIAGMTIVATFFVGHGALTASSRVTYAYGRDGVFPFSNHRFGPGRVNKYTNTPINAIWINTIIAILLNLLVFGGPLTISAIFAMGAVGQYFAFTLPIVLRTFGNRERFRPGPWNLGRWSFLCGVVSTMFTSVMLPLLCFPSVRGSDLTPATMNWTVVVWGGPMVFAMCWWALSARKWFKGPKVNIEHKSYQLLPPNSPPDSPTSSTKSS